MKNAEYIIVLADDDHDDQAIIKEIFSIHSDSITILNVLDGMETLHLLERLQKKRYPSLPHYSRHQHAAHERPRNLAVYQNAREAQGRSGGTVQYFARRERQAVCPTAWRQLHLKAFHL